MRIGELAQRLGVTTDAVRFYERAGHLPRAARQENRYREYSEADADHLRLLIDLRRLDLQLDDAARIASWCHSGHCVDTRAALPALLAARRAQVARRIAGLQLLDQRLAELERHLSAKDGLPLPMLVDKTPCCDAAGAVVGTVEGLCSCCASSAAPSIDSR